MTNPKSPPQHSGENTGNLHAERKIYQQGELHRDQMPPNPLVLFEQWIQKARDMKLLDATSMTLATATTSGIPSSRTVLLKQYDEAGFCWYTSYESRKGQELAQNPNAALLFYWRELERQVRIDGTVEKVSAEQSDSYFNSRPEGSKYSAAVSPQSTVVPNQAWLSDAIEKLANNVPPDQLQRPDSWGGYRLSPGSIEFWQGRPSRSHDRFVYKKTPQGIWQIDRLAP